MEAVNSNSVPSLGEIQAAVDQSLMQWSVSDRPSKLSELFGNDLPSSNIRINQCICLGLGPLLSSNPYSKVFNQYVLLVVTPYWLPFLTLKTRPKLSAPDTYPDIVLYQDYQSLRILGRCAFYHAIAHS